MNEFLTGLYKILGLSLIFCNLIAYPARAQRVDTVCSKKYTALSESFQQESNFDQALDAATKAIACWRNNGDLWVKRASIKNALKNFSEAKNDIDTAIALGSSSSYFYQTKGINEYGRGKISAAIGSFSKAINLDNEDEVSYYYVIGSLASMEKYNEALKYIDQAYEHFKPDPQLLIQKSALCITLKKYDPVILACTEYLKNPGSDESFAYCYRGMAYVRLNRFEEGISDLTKATQLNKELSLPFLYLGIAFRETGDILKARKYFDQAIKANPEPAENYWEYAAMEQQFTDRPAFAVSLLEKYHQHLGREPVNSLYYLYLANCYDELGDTLKTLESFENGFKLDSANTFQLHFYRLGTFIGKNKYIDLQLKDINYIITSNHIDPVEIAEFNNLKGYIFLLADKKDSLHEILLKNLQIAIEERKYIAAYNLAMYELFYGEKFGKTEKVMKYLNESIKLTPTLEAYFAKAFLVKQLDKNGEEEAKAILSEAKRNFSNDQSKLEKIDQMENSVKKTDPSLSSTDASREDEFIYYLLPKGKFASVLLLGLDPNTPIPPAVKRFFLELQK